VNRIPVIFIGAFAAFALSGFLFLVSPQLQVGQQSFATVLNSTDTYPRQPSGLARQGAEVYRANGCAYCHSQQVRQTGIQFSVLLTDAGTNPAAVLALLPKAAAPLKLPQTVASGDRAGMVTLAAQLQAAAGKAEVQVAPVGADIARGWGLRRSVAADYIFQSPAMLGSQRVGPDLANVGLRLSDADWQLRHLYNPQFAVTGSAMPPYPYLFELRKIAFNRPSPDALAVKCELPAGYEVVPTSEARALVAYLQSLRADAPLFEAPMSK
jgi:cbb3-type cytochrome oxidase cytochrome c subunit